MDERKPQHLHFINSRLRWDWRRENPVEIILLVFTLVFFFTAPREGCGVTPAAQASAEAAPGVGAAVKVEPVKKP